MTGEIIGGEFWLFISGLFLGVVVGFLAGNHHGKKNKKDSNFQDGQTSQEAKSDSSDTAEGENHSGVPHGSEEVKSK